MSGLARSFGPGEMRSNHRWESWGDRHPPSFVYSPAGCQLEKVRRSPEATSVLILAEYGWSICWFVCSCVRWVDGLLIDLLVVSLVDRLYDRSTG